MKKFTFLLVLLVTGILVKAQYPDYTYTYDLDFKHSPKDSAGCNPFLLQKNYLNSSAGYFKVSHGSPDFLDKSTSAVKLKASYINEGSGDVRKSEGLFTKIDTANFSTFDKFRKGYIYRVGLIDYSDT
ncbi:MAG: hypothetical protein KGY70_14670 [Bacteroidales bacterium]|nr:hypothetical protein [Bacteroidales bacterium]MBS3776436.1 hypothetical protein [Bacteroidales bacterium]